MKIYWATRLRGFLKHISECVDEIEFEQKEHFFEVSNKKTELKNRIVRSKLLDTIGLFQVIKIEGKECDFYASFNRFLDADKPYFIYLENPTALYHYALGRLRYHSGKNKFRKCLENPKLKYIVCMSDSCRTTFEKVNMRLPENVKMKTIYPLIPKNRYVSEELLSKKSYSEILELLYCVQGKRFYTKGGREILEVVTDLQKKGLKIHLTVISNLSSLSEETLNVINENSESISLYDFSFSYKQMEKIYADTAILLQPSSDDSCPLTVLEAVKGGCAVLGSDMYAIPEMVEHNVNGLLIEPAFRTFSKNNLPNPYAWGHQKKVRLAEKRSQKYVDDIEAAIRTLYNDRDKLYEFSKKSLELANTKFSEESISAQWSEVWNVLKGKDENET